jgi:hypothetical protein
MATHHGKNGVVKVGSNAVAEVDRWSARESVDTVDDTAMGDAAQTHLTGIPGWSGQITCHWDETDTNGQEALTIGASVTLNLYPEGAASGATYKTGTATITEIGLDVTKNGVVSREFSFTGNGALSQTTV